MARDGGTLQWHVSQWPSPLNETDPPPFCPLLLALGVVEDLPQSATPDLPFMTFASLWQLLFPLVGHSLSTPLSPAGSGS
eukprot:915982-Heterocapsa_arctica.AAC.1